MWSINKISLFVPSGVQSILKPLIFLGSVMHWKTTVLGGVTLLCEVTPFERKTAPEREFTPHGVVF